VPHFFYLSKLQVMETTNIRNQGKDDGKPYGYIANFVKTEWGYLPNIKQLPS
jgi:hypothetical protein